PPMPRCSVPRLSRPDRQGTIAPCPAQPTMPADHAARRHSRGAQNRADKAITDAGQPPQEPRPPQSLVSLRATVPNDENPRRERAPRLRKLTSICPGDRRPCRPRQARYSLGCDFYGSEETTASSPPRLAAKPCWH